MKFKAIVNPFLKRLTVIGKTEKCTFTEEIIFNDVDEWNAFEMDGNKFDIHFLYQEGSDLCIEIYHINGTGEYSPEIEIMY